MPHKGVPWIVELMSLEFTYFFPLCCIFLQLLMAHLINPKMLVATLDYHMVIRNNIRLNRMVDDGQVGNIGEYSG